MTQSIKIIHIYFNSGAELMTTVSPQAAADIYQDIITGADLIELDRDDQRVIIPLSSVERLEIEK